MTAPEAQALPFDFMGLAQCTKSDQFHGELVTRDELLQTIGAAIAILNKLDAIKKSLFYGRAFQLQDELQGAITCAGIVQGWGKPHMVDGVRSPSIRELVPTDKAVDIVHAILGKATEDGELLELLNEVIRTGNFDPVNFKEEMFDGQWYDAVGCAAIGVTFEEGQRNNIAKLRKRYGPKFSEYDANNRDLAGEREVLEVTSRFSGDIVEKVVGKTITREFVGKAHFDGHDISHDPV